MPRRHHLVLAAAALVVVGCNPPGAVNGGTESSLSTGVRPGQAGSGGAGGTAAQPVKVWGQVSLKTPEGKPLNGVAVRIGGKTVLVKDGLVTITEEMYAAAQAEGGLVILGGGFMPVTVPLTGVPEAGIVMIPQEGLSRPGLLSAGGGTLSTLGELARITIPTNLVESADTAILVATYRPLLPADAQGAFERDAAGLIAAHAKLTGQAAPAGAACGAPFDCSPVTGALGVSVTVDGKIEAGEMKVSLDLAKMTRGWDGQGTPPWETDPGAWTAGEIADAKAARRILDTFAAMDATKDTAWRQAMQDTYGLSLQGTLLTFPVKLGDAQAKDGTAAIEVDGLSVLGARLEVTVLSATGGVGSLSRAVPIAPGDVPSSLIEAVLPGWSEGRGSNGPDALVSSAVSLGDGKVRIRETVGGTVLTASELLTNSVNTLVDNVTGAVTLEPAAPLISNNSGGLISNNSGGLISNNSGGLISNNSGGFISNNAAGIISDNAGGLISNNSGGIISNNAGGLISDNGSMLTGSPFFPFEPQTAKYQLLQLGVPAVERSRTTATGLTEYLWPLQARARAIRADGTPLTGWALTDAYGSFQLPLPAQVPAIFYIQAETSVTGDDGLPRRAYAMAYAPGPQKATSVPIDASTTMVSTSTLHLLDYIPGEFRKLVAVARYTEAQAAATADDMAGQQYVAPAIFYKLQQQSDASPAPGASSSPAPKNDPRLEAALRTYNSSTDILNGRNTVLDGAWNAFAPFQYNRDLGVADGTATLDSARAISTATTLRAAYDPMYGFAQQGRFDPGSYRAIDPDSPAIPATVPAGVY